MEATNRLLLKEDLYQKYSDEEIDFRSLQDEIYKIDNPENPQKKYFQILKGIIGIVLPLLFVKTPRND